MLVKGRRQEVKSEKYENKKWPDTCQVSDLMGEKVVRFYRFKQQKIDFFLIFNLAYSLRWIGIDQQKRFVWAISQALPSERFI